MAAALDIISRAMRLAGVYSIGEAPSADESQNCLAALNAMVGTFSNSSLLVNAETLDAIPLVAGTSVYTLGATGTVVTTRPVEILDVSYVLYQNISTPCPLITLGQYNEIAYKGQTAPYPYGMKYEATYPNGTLTVYPVPSDSSVLNLWSLKPLTGFAALATTVNLPPGYEDMLAFNLAVVIAPEFDGASISPTVEKMAINTKRGIARTNTKPLIMDLPNAVMGTRHFVDWRSGA